MKPPARDPLAVVGGWSEWLEEQGDRGIYEDPARAARMWLEEEGVRVDPHVAVAFTTAIFWTLGVLVDDSTDPYDNREACLVAGEFHRLLMLDLASGPSHGQ